MKTYFFTIATPGKYSSFAKDLLQTAWNFGLEIDVLGREASGGRDAKLLKMDGILGAPGWAERIVFIDADTLLVDPSGLENHNGAMLEPWRHPEGMYAAEHPDKTIKRARIEKLYGLAKKEGLTSAIPGGPYAGAEWNSGVITGERKYLEELVLEWKKWWALVLEANDGEFRRDQISFKFAYIKIHKEKYNLPDLPREYNWLVKRWGFKPQAKILHKAGRPNHQACRLWDAVKEHLFRKDYQGFFSKRPQAIDMPTGYEEPSEPRKPSAPPQQLVILAPRDLQKNLHWINPYPTCDCPKGKRCKHGGDFSSLEQSYVRALCVLEPKKIVEWSPDPTATIPLKMGIQVLSITPKAQQWDFPGYHPRPSSPDDPNYFDISGWEDSDLFFVDWRERCQCIDLVYHKAKESAVVVVHDAQRKRYQENLTKFPFVVFLDRGFCLASRDPKIMKFNDAGESPKAP